LKNHESLSSFPGLLLCFVDFSGQFKQATPAFAKALGRTAIQLPTQPDTETNSPQSLQSYTESQSVWPNLLDLVHPQDRQTTEQALSQLSRSTDEISFETRCQHSDGNYHWLLWKATAVPEEHGFYAVITDISAYKPPATKMNEAAVPQVAHEHLLLVLDSLDALVYVADIETYEILYENQYGRTVFGDFVGKICWQAFLRQNSPCPFCSKKKVLTEDGQGSASHQWECYSTLTNRWYAVHDRAIRWIDGRLVRLEIAYDITERKQVEQSLELSKERYMLAVRAGKTGVWDWNLETNEMYLGPHLKVLLGLADLELPNPLEAWMALVHPDDVTRLRKASRDYLRKRISRFEEEYRLLDQDGNIRWMIVRGTAMRDEQERAYRMVGTNTDITERKQFEEYLQEQQRLWHGVAQITHTLLTVPDDDKAIHSALSILGHLTAVDRAYLFENYMVPATGESVINQRFTWVNKKYKPYNTFIKLKNISYAHYLPGWYDTLEKDEPIAGLVKDFPQPIRSLLASYQVVSILIVPIHFNRQFWGFIGLDDCHRERQWLPYEIFALKVIGDSIRGTLARKQFKESLRRSEAKFRSIIESSRDAIIVCDKEGFIRFVNPAAEKLYKAPVGGMIGKNFCAPFDAKNKAEFKFKDLEGHSHVGELQLSSIEWEGEPLSLASLRDITERKQVEIELQKNKEAAEAANRFKSLFLAAMSHEIRTPMNGVLGLTELLQKTTLTRQQQHYARMIENSGQVLLTVINDILDFSRIEAGKGLVLNIVEFEPRKLVEDMVNLFAASAQGKGLEILCQLPPQLPKTLRGDPSRLRQILNNLLGNAIKFTSSGEVLLRLSVSSKTSTRVVLHFEVIDTGIGIEPSVRNHLFQLYFRTEDSNIQYQGAGLGLFISRQLVYKMGGEIDLKSEYGKGSTFWFKLPLSLISDQLPVSSHQLSESDLSVLSEQLSVLSHQLSDSGLSVLSEQLSVISHQLSDSDLSVSSEPLSVSSHQLSESDLSVLSEQLSVLSHQLLESDLLVLSEQLLVISHQLSESDLSVSSEQLSVISRQLSETDLSMISNQLSVISHQLSKSDFSVISDQLSVISHQLSKSDFSVISDQLSVISHQLSKSDNLVHQTGDSVETDNWSSTIEKLRSLKMLIVDDNATSRQILLEETRAWRMDAVAVESCKASLALLREAAVKGAPFQLALIDAEIPTLKDGLALLQEIKADPRFVNLNVVMMTTLQHLLEPYVIKQLAGYLNKPIFQADLLRCLLTAIESPEDDVGGAGSDNESEIVPSRWQVLLAEDNVINQEVAKETLRQLGCNVHIAANGWEAIDATEQQDFDLIFMDCSMPELDGYTASRKIREREKQQGKRHVPIIAFTADVMPSTRERCLTAGMDDYLTKPLIISELENKLGTWLENQESRSLGVPDERMKGVQNSETENAVIQTENAVETEKRITDNGSLRTDEENPVDFNILNEMRQNLHSSKLNWIIDLYLQELPTYLATLQQAVASQDGEALYLAAHKFKGASAILGAQRVVALCKVLEKLGRDGTADKAQEPLALMDAECESLKQALEQQAKISRGN
jgi:PAS domain S-box-containing protein